MAQNQLKQLQHKLHNEIRKQSETKHSISGSSIKRFRQETGEKIVEKTNLIWIEKENEVNVWLRLLRSG